MIISLREQTKYIALPDVRAKVKYRGFFFPLSIRRDLLHFVFEGEGVARHRSSCRAALRSGERDAAKVNVSESSGFEK